MNPTQKCYSADDEMFNRDSLGDLIDQMEDPKVGDTYYEADCRPIEVSDYVNKWTISGLLENMDECLYEAVGEGYDNNASDVPQEAKDELLSLLKTWAEKHINFGSYWLLVGKSREMKFTAEDLS